MFSIMTDLVTCRRHVFGVLYPERPFQLLSRYYLNDIESSHIRIFDTIYHLHMRPISFVWHHFKLLVVDYDEWEQSTWIAWYLFTIVSPFSMKLSTLNWQLNTPLNKTDFSVEISPKNMSWYLTLYLQHSENCMSRWVLKSINYFSS